MNIRNVRLELLRHGPPHNQLLSPLTRYLGICGNHTTVTVHVPYEHAQFLARHNALNYGTLTQFSTAAGQYQILRNERELQLQLTAQEVASLLATIPGLIADLRATDRTEELVHLELILSASELALLPFELADSPSGFPGTGHPLALQSHSPVCITRRANRIDTENFAWPRRNKILFASSLPKDAVHDQLVKDHLLALRAAIDPWICRRNGANSLAEQLEFLPFASVANIEDALRLGDFTHVHILSHGTQQRVGVDDRFGLALYKTNSTTEFECVTADRLEMMIKTLRSSSQFACPAVVTLASCYGAAQGTIIGVGSSIAHAMHESGIPLVVASQFPLSFRGSVLMASKLYSGLLWGRDPRLLLYDLRRSLKSQLGDAHDWASIVAYAAFPADFDRTLSEVRYYRVRSSIEAVFKQSDAFGSTQEANLAQTIAKGLDTAREEMKLLQNELENARVVNKFRLSFIHGQYASGDKRRAELHYFKKLNNDGGNDWREWIRKARDEYNRAFDLDRSQTWALVQSLVTEAVLNDHVDPARSEHELWIPPAKSEFRKQVRTACLLTRRDLDLRPKDLELAWALGNLIELELLTLRLKQYPSYKSFKQDLEKRLRRMRKWAEQIDKNLDNEKFQRRSTTRQLKRYREWFLKAIRKTDTKISPRNWSEATQRSYVASGIYELCSFSLKHIRDDSDFVPSDNKHAPAKKTAREGSKEGKSRSP